MQKFTAGSLAVMTLSALLLVGCSVGLNNNGDGKHTGPVTVRSSGGGHFSSSDDYSAQFEFIRPNKEVFEMTFRPGTPTPRFGVGDQLADLVYTDSTKGAVFVKAVLDKEYVAPPPPSPSDLTLYTNSVASWTCYGNQQGCDITQGSPKTFYLWNDGAYRDKPDPNKKKCK